MPNIGCHLSISNGFEAIGKQALKSLQIGGRIAAQKRFYKPCQVFRKPPLGCAPDVFCADIRRPTLRRRKKRLRKTVKLRERRPVAKVYDRANSKERVVGGRGEPATKPNSRFKGLARGLDAAVLKPVNHASKPRFDDIGHGVVKAQTFKFRQDGSLIGSHLAPAHIVGKIGRFKVDKEICYLQSEAFKPGGSVGVDYLQNVKVAISKNGAVGNSRPQIGVQRYHAPANKRVDGALKN